MALRDQPYLPLYVQDFMTDEKLAECSASATGVYVRLMCLMHKSEDYGTILLKQKYKQSTEQIKNFATQIAKQMPYDFHTVTKSLEELVNEKVILMEGDMLIQKRMVKDNKISTSRAKTGAKGGVKTAKKFAKAKPAANGQAKGQANSEYEYEYDNEDEFKDGNGKGGAGEKVVLPFSSIEFRVAWHNWKNHLSNEHQRPYHTFSTEQAAVDDLAKISLNSESFAIHNIKHSISKNWKSIHADNNYGKQQQLTGEQKRAGVENLGRDSLTKLLGGADS